MTFMHLGVFVFFLIGALGTGAMDTDIVMYAATAAAIIFYLILYIKKHEKSSLVCIILVSIISPSNYIIIVSLILVAVLCAKKIRIQKSQWVLVCMVIYVTLISVIRLITGQQKITNLFFAFLFYLPLLASDLTFSDFSLDSEEYERVIDFMKKSLVVEWVAILSRLVFHSDVLKGIDFDWVTGTFGISQGNLLLFYAVFCFLVFGNEFIKRKKCLLWSLAAAFMGIMTGSIALIIMFAFAFIVYMFLSRDVSVRIKIISAGLIAALIVLFIVVTPQWIKNYIVTIVTSDDKASYISKLNDYARVFVSIPRNDLVFALIGCGLGMYCSRGALTCTGLYLDSYNRLFSPSMSEYTSRYIYPKLKTIYQKGLGSMDTPFSSVMSVFAETGIIGLILLIVYLVERYIHSKYISRIFVIFFALSLFIENYLEFGRVVPLLFLASVCVEGLKNREKEGAYGTENA